MVNKWLVTPLSQEPPAGACHAFSCSNPDAAQEHRRAFIEFGERTGFTHLAWLPVSEFHILRTVDQDQV